MEVRGDAGATKAGHGGARVRTIGQGGVGDAETRRGVEAGDAVPGVELFSPYGSEVKEEEVDVDGIGVKAGWRQPFMRDTRLSSLDFKGIRLLPVICQFSAQPNIQLHLPVVFNLI